MFHHDAAFLLAMSLHCATQCHEENIYMRPHLIMRLSFNQEATSIPRG